MVFWSPLKMSEYRVLRHVSLKFQRAAFKKPPFVAIPFISHLFLSLYECAPLCTLLRLKTLLKVTFISFHPVLYRYMFFNSYSHIDRDF